MRIGYPWFFALCLFVSGCAATDQNMRARFLTPFEATKLIEESPYVTKLIDENFESRAKPETIQLFYYPFSPINHPATVQDWEQHYVIERGSEPKRRYTQLADIQFYQSFRDDAVPLTKMRELAATLGGDAVINLHRTPIGEVDRQPSPILAYMYYGVVVRYDNAKK